MTMIKKRQKPQQKARKATPHGSAQTKSGRAASSKRSRQSELTMNDLQHAARTVAHNATGTSGLRVKETAVIPYGSSTQWISASDFKAQCLELMDRVRTDHEQIVVTKYGEPVAKLVPFDEDIPDIVGFMRGSVLAYGDLIAPIDESWDANQ
jgi:prevent-host-death family protein